MYDAESAANAGPLEPVGACAPGSTVESAIERAAAALTRAQREDGHWVFELEADATIPAEYVLLRHFLGEPDDPSREAAIGRYLRRVQGRDGGWPLFHGGAFDVSATVKAYFALKVIGDDIEAPHMTRARVAVLAAGGARAVNVFTRLQLALFGAGSWRAAPAMPVELVLLPRWFPIHLGKMSYWARTVLVSLLVLQALKPVACNPRGVVVPELYAPAGAPKPRRPTHQKRLWRWGFGALDAALKAFEPFWPAGLRRRAIAWARDFVTERLNGEDGLGAIYPAMANTVMMFAALGVPEEDPHRAAARRAVENLLVLDPEDRSGADPATPEIYCQPCVSPVWDTALAAHALLEVGGAAAEKSALAALAWLKPLQVLDVRGDWAGRRPQVRPGGWAFQYANPHYPDLDDTAVVVMAMDRARRTLGASGYDEAIARGVEWTLGLQSRDGGFAAFDADNFHAYLNNIPFADHGALLDPPTEDVTGRVVSMLGQLAGGGNGDAEGARLNGADAYLTRTQGADGAWFGRWGVNYVYGTWSVLCALNAVGVGPDAPRVRRAVEWLGAIQNPDGGWGEDCDSYALDYAGHHPHPSNASQTAWALLALMAAGEVRGASVARGVRWLLERQADDGLWEQAAYTGGGFPRVFYLRYHGYPKYFPLWALARYRNLLHASGPTPWGM